jgi:hypothetical protein
LKNKQFQIRTAILETQKGKHSSIVKNSTVQKKFLDVRIQPQGELKDKNFGIESYGEHTTI